MPLAPDDKPEWLLEGYGGKMPCLVHDEEVRRPANPKHSTRMMMYESYSHIPFPPHTQAYTDSSTITQYLEYFFPGERPLTIEDPELDEEVKAATGGVFGAFARYVRWSRTVD